VREAVESAPPRQRLFHFSPAWRAYAQLIRLPNVFTAMADIGLGWCAALASGTPVSRWPILALLLASSACLYSSGMVWNDFFDIEQDRRGRPFRPLPSGRISRRQAGFLGVTLLAAGVILALLVGSSMDASHWTVGWVAGILVLAILLYDGWLKRTWAGPIAMGSCRFLNVLLGLTIAPDSLLWGPRIYLALVVGVYIVGVTWFARTEASTSSKESLAAAAGIQGTALLLSLAVPVWFGSSTTSVLFPYLLVVLGFLVGIPACRAIARPTPPLVQAAVKRALIGLVILDAILASALIGTAGLVLLVLLLPLLYLGRWIYST
jgi:4-hydroxybenzoate polyprenyltransferase